MGRLLETERIGMWIDNERKNYVEMDIRLYCLSFEWLCRPLRSLA